MMYRHMMIGRLGLMSGIVCRYNARTCLCTLGGLLLLVTAASDDANTSKLV